MNTNTMELTLNDMEMVNGAGAGVFDGAIHFYKRVTNWTKDVAIPACEEAAKATGEFCKNAANATANICNSTVNWVKSWF